MKKIISALLALSVIFAFTGCMNKSEPKADLKEITVCLDWTPNTNHTGLYVALEKGYYEQANLNVRIVQPPEDGSVLMCASGEAQFAVSAQDIIAPSLSLDEPMEITAVAALVQHNTSGIISRKSDNINTAKDLEGKTYSTWDSPVELAIIKHIMEKDGADFDNLKLIPNVITDEAGALLHGDTDAIWIFYGWGGINAKLQGLDFNYLDFISVDKIFDYYTPILVANNAFLESDGETAKAFLAATRKGYEYAVQNPEEAARILIDCDTTHSLSDSEKLVTESQKWLSTQYIADAESWGVIDSERWDGFYAWLWENKLIDRELDSSAGFTNDYLS